MRVKGYGRERGSVFSHALPPTTTQSWCHATQYRQQLQGAVYSHKFPNMYFQETINATSCIIVVGVCHFVWVRRRHRLIQITPKNDFLYLPLDKSSSLSVFSVISVSSIHCNQMLFRKHSTIMHPNLITIEIIRRVIDMLLSELSELEQIWTTRKIWMNTVMQNTAHAFVCFHFCFQFDTK